jgi:hypothetical protein
MNLHCSEYLKSVLVLQLIYFIVYHVYSTLCAFIVSYINLL